MVQREKKGKRKTKSPWRSAKEGEEGGWRGNELFYGQTGDLFVFVIRADPSTSITARPFSSASWDRNASRLITHPVQGTH